MSDFTRHDDGLGGRNVVLDDEFDPDTFIFNMNEGDWGQRAASGRRSALALLERRNEERWLREQLRELDDDLAH